MNYHLTPPWSVEGGEERREPLVFVLHLVRMVSDNGVWKRRRETKAGQRFHR